MDHGHTSQLHAYRQRCIRPGCTFCVQMTTSPLRILLFIVFSGIQSHVLAVEQRLEKHRWSPCLPVPRLVLSGLWTDQSVTVTTELHLRFDVVGTVGISL